MAGPSAVIVGAAAAAGGVLLRRRKIAVTGKYRARHSSLSAHEANADRQWRRAYRTDHPTLPELPFIVDQDATEAGMCDPWQGRPQRRPQDVGRPNR